MTRKVRKLAEMAWISVAYVAPLRRDGLLRRPPNRGGLRLYRERELLRLQQILFFRELDVPLEEIRRSWPVRVRPGAALRQHRGCWRRSQAVRPASRRSTRRYTCWRDMPLSDAELYEGF